jgi:hypothetical protein
MSTSGREVAQCESRARLETGLRAARMADDLTIIAGIPIPANSPLFLSVVGFHVLAGLPCTITGVVAMLSNKARGRHSNFGTVYYWGLMAVFVTATALAAARWGGLSLVHFRGALTCGGVFGPPGAPTILAELATAAPYGNGSVLYPAVDGILRGQWQELAALERASTASPLAVAERGGSADRRLCATAPSPGPKVPERS